MQDDPTTPGGGTPAWTPTAPPAQVPDPAGDVQVPAEPTVPPPSPAEPSTPPADPGTGGTPAGGWTPPAPAPTDAPGGDQGTNQGGTV